MTPEAFNQRIREIVLAQYPDADVSFTVSFSQKVGAHSVIEHDGKLCCDMLGGIIPLSRLGAPKWSFTVFSPNSGWHPFMPRGTIYVDSKQVERADGSFADRMGNALLKSIAERLKSDSLYH